VSTSVGNFATNRRHMALSTKKALKMKKRKPANKTNVKKINVFSRVKNLLSYFEENLGEFNSEELNKLSIRDIIERCVKKLNFWALLVFDRPFSRLTVPCRLTVLYIFDRPFN
jgi:chromatin segregation and condensation protein Rec8/ScpA/Scc1 (kleisin family)